MPRKVAAVALPLPTGEKTCFFCGLKDDNELEYGKIHEYQGIVTHYYCLLLSSNMQQRGNDDEGILGFLPEDINKELKRGKRLACCYCKKIGATLGCCNTKCKRIFHFPCGLKSGSLHQFFGEFKSYCKTHRPAQKIDERVSQEVKTRESMICYICYDDVNPRDMLGTLWAPCCKKNAWFHRGCVQQLAMSAGYFFKCPLCNNKTEFQKAMLDHGIFIPSQDASWELVPNAFEELLYRHNRCDAHKCICPKGREHVSTNAKWELTLCRTCGSQGIHMACGRLKWVKPIWECTECTSILNKSIAGGHSDAREGGKTLQNGDVLTDDESSDSDISVGGVSDTRVPVPSVTRSHEPAKAPRTDDELPPVPKKPRISVIRAAESLAADSDDDVIVISGPSRKESTVVPTNGVNVPVDQFERFQPDLQVTEADSKVEAQSPTSVRQHDASSIEKPETPARFPSESSRPAEIRVVKRPSSGTQRPPPVEIDLSEGEITVPEGLSTFEAKRPDDAFGDSSELNIKISNVTSLAPGAFDLVPESRSRQININVMNGGLTPTDPIVLDGGSALKVSHNNNTLYDSSRDQLRIVKFDGAPNCPRSESNSVIYGLTIPGTNHTVPLIVTPPDNCKSKTPGLHADPNNPLGVALCDCNSSRASSITDILNLSVFSGSINNSTTTSSTTKTFPTPNVSRKADSSQSASSTASSAKKRVEKPTAPQSIDPKMWSVPLKSIVQGTIPKSAAESALNIVNNSMFVGNFSSFDSMNCASDFSKQTLQATNIVQNGFGSSLTPVVWSNPTTPQQYFRIAPVDVPPPNEVVPQFYALLPASQNNAVTPMSLPATQAKIATPITLQATQAKIAMPMSLQATQANIATPMSLQVTQAKTATPMSLQVTQANIATPMSLQVTQAKTVTPMSLQVTQAKTATPNGVVSSAKSKSVNVPPNATSVNAVWVKVNGSYMPVDPAIAKEFVTATTPPPAQLPAQKSTTNYRISKSATNYQVSKSGTNLQVSKSGTNLQVSKSGTNYQVSKSGTNHQVSKSGKKYQVSKTSTNYKITKSATTYQSPKSAMSDSNFPMIRSISPDKNDTDDPSNNCDGDAGSDPAVQPASVSPNAGHDRPRNAGRSPSELGAVLDDQKPADADGTVAARCGHQEDVAAECPATPDGGYSCNRIGLINKTINLRDIKFTIGGPDIVKMTLYETYNVNVKVATTGRCKYDAPDSEVSSLERTHRTSLTPGDKVSSTANFYLEDTVDSPKNECSSAAVGSRNDAALNETESAPENNDATTKIIATPAQVDVSSRGQDELKENRDPVPATNNSTEAAMLVDRKSKTRSRAGVNDHSMRSLNEKEGQETVGEKIATSPSKIVANETQLVVIPSKVCHNGCKERNETGPLVASIEADANNSITARNSVNDGAANGDAAEHRETAKRRRISDGNSSRSRDSGKSTTADDSSDYNCNGVAKAAFGKASGARMAEHFETAKRRQTSVKDGSSSGARDSDRATTGDESKKFNYANGKLTTDNVRAHQIREHFEATKRRRTSINCDNETRDSTRLETTDESKSHNCAKINSLVNTAARSKRKFSESSHICRREELRGDDALRNDETAASEEYLCCKVSIDLTRIREVLATKLNVLENVEFHEQSDERSAKKCNANSNDDSETYFKRKKMLSRSRSFDSLAGRDRPRGDRSSSVDLRRSQSFDNLNCFSLKRRRPNGVMDDDSSRCSKRRTRSFEKHDCVR